MTKIYRAVLAIAIASTLMACSGSPTEQDVTNDEASYAAVAEENGAAGSPGDFASEDEQDLAVTETETAQDREEPTEEDVTNDETRIVALTEAFVVRASSTCRGTFRLSVPSGINMWEWGKQYELSYEFGDPMVLNPISHIAVQTPEEHDALMAIGEGPVLKVVFRSDDIVVGEWGHPRNGLVTNELDRTSRVMESDCDYSVAPE